MLSEITPPSARKFGRETDDILDLFLPDQGQPPVKQQPKDQETLHIDHKCEMETADTTSNLPEIFDQNSIVSISTLALNDLIHDSAAVSRWLAYPNHAQLVNIISLTTKLDILRHVMYGQQYAATASRLVQILMLVVANTPSCDHFWLVLSAPNTLKQLLTHISSDVLFLKSGCGCFGMRHLYRISCSH